MKFGRVKRIALRHWPDLEITATVDVFTGRPLVEVWSDNAFADPMNLTPAEARRLSAALAHYAGVAERKRDRK